MKLTPASFITSYARLGVRFEWFGEIVVPVGEGVSPVFVDEVEQRSAWLAPWLHVQDAAPGATGDPVNVESTEADRLIWSGIINAKRKEERRKAIKGWYR